MLNRLHIAPPQLPLVANVTGELYPPTIEAIKDILELQIAAPVQWVKGLETLHANGIRTFIEVGPKKALKGFVDDVLGSKPEVVSLFTNHPKTGELASFNQALCGLYATGYAGSSEFKVQSSELPTGSSKFKVQSSELPQTTDGGRPFEVAQGRRTNDARPATMNGTATVAASVAVPQIAPALRAEEMTMTNENGANQSAESLNQLLMQALQGIAATQTSALKTQNPTTMFDRNAVPTGSVVIEQSYASCAYGMRKPCLRKHGLRTPHVQTT